MMPGHCPLLDPPAEAVAHDHVVARPQLLDERHQILEVIRVVRISHDEILAFGGLESSHQRVAVPLLFDVDYAGPSSAGNLYGAICRAVVGHDDLARNSGPGEKI